MRNLFILFAVLVLFQCKSDYLKSDLKDEYPEILEEYVVKISNNKLFSSGKLITGIDSVNVYFGEKYTICDEQKFKGYWISVLLYDSMLFSYRGISLESEDSSNILSKDLSIELPNSVKFDVRIIHDTLTDHFSYIWLDNGKVCRTLKTYPYDDEAAKITGSLLPYMEFATLNNDTINTKDLKGKIVVINWWHTRCGPCVIEIPGFNKLVAKYKTNPKVYFLAIAHDERDIVEKFLEKNNFDYLHALGSQKFTELIGSSFPTNIILNPEGVITYYSTGGSENMYIDIDSEIEKILDRNKAV